jgi:hypothetical protein
MFKVYFLFFKLIISWSLFQVSRSLWGEAVLTYCSFEMRYCLRHRGFLKQINLCNRNYFFRQVLGVIQILRDLASRLDASWGRAYDGRLINVWKGMAFLEFICLVVWAWRHDGILCDAHRLKRSSCVIMMAPIYARSRRGFRRSVCEVDWEWCVFIFPAFLR